MVNTSKLKLTYLQSGILRKLFIKTGSSLNQRQLSLELGVSQPAIKKALPYLEELGFIVVHKDVRLDISLNSDNGFVVCLKRVDNLKHVYESGLATFLEHSFAGATIILFGSFSRGEDTVLSDIDVAVVGRTEKLLDLSEFEREFERTININFYPSFDMIHTRLKENLANGIVITGGFLL